MRSKNYDAPKAGSCAAIWPAKMYHRNAAIGIGFKPMGYGTGFKPSPGILRFGRVHTRIILGTDWTERHMMTQPRVLLVDDEPQMLRALRLVLRAYPCASVIVNVKVKTPACVVEPERTPLELNVTPGGR